LNIVIDIKLINLGYCIWDAAEQSPIEVTPRDSALWAVTGLGYWWGPPVTLHTLLGNGCCWLLAFRKISFALLVTGWNLFHLEDGGKMPCSSQQTLMCQLITAFANMYL